MNERPTNLADMLDHVAFELDGFDALCKALDKAGVSGISFDGGPSRPIPLPENDNVQRDLRAVAQRIRAYQHCYEATVLADLWPREQS